MFSHTTAAGILICFFPARSLKLARLPYYNLTILRTLNSSAAHSDAPAPSLKLGRLLFYNYLDASLGSAYLPFRLPRWSLVACLLAIIYPLQSYLCILLPAYSLRLVKPFFLQSFRFKKNLSFIPSFFIHSPPDGGVFFPFLWQQFLDA